MAPPGYNPPSYVHNTIPERYMHKNLPPPEIDTNGRAYLIFFSYLGLCVSLSVLVIFKLIQNYNALHQTTSIRQPNKRHVRFFATLAALSLITTWYYMFSYFQVSYQTWAMWRSRFEISQDKMHWGLWLKETSLFKENWETIIVGNARYWWSHQIFFFACGLGLSLEDRGRFPLPPPKSRPRPASNEKQVSVVASSLHGSSCCLVNLSRSALPQTFTFSPYC